MIKRLLARWLGFQDEIDYLRDERASALRRIRALYKGGDRLVDRIALLEAELRVARGEPDGSHDIEDPYEAAWPEGYEESLRWVNG